MDTTTPEPANNVNTYAGKNNSGTLGACNFCRKMHSSCEGRPRCNNCVIRGIECVFMEKKKPGPPLGYKKRKTQPSGTRDLDKKPKRVEPTRETAPARVEIILPTTKVASHSNTSPIITIRTNPRIPTPTVATPQTVPYSVEYYHPKEPSRSLYSYGRPTYVPEVSLTAVPSSPYPMLYPYNQDIRSSDGLSVAQGFSSSSLPPSPESLLHPATPTTGPNTPGNCTHQSSHHHHSSPHSYPATPGSHSPFLSGGHSFGSPSSSPATPLAPASPSSPSSEDNKNKNNSNNKTERTSLEITIPSSSSFSSRRINPDRFFAAAAPYVHYLEVFQRVFQEDALGIFPFIEIPPLEHLLPLAGMTREGRLSQILLFTVLSMGALNIGEPSQFHYFGESAFKIADDYIQEEKGRRRNTLSKKELQQECISFLLLSVIDHASGNFTRAPLIARYVFEISNELFSDAGNRYLDHTTGWMVAHINAKSKILFSRDEKVRSAQQFLATLPTADPGVKLFTIFSSVLDQMVEVCCLGNDLSASDFGWMQSLVNQAEDLLSYLNTMPCYGESCFRKSYAAIFQGIRAVMLYITGCYTSSVPAATNAAYQIIDCLGDTSFPVFFGIPLTLAFVTKVHCLNNNPQMLDVCLKALKQYEQRFPAIKFFWSALEIPTTVNPMEGWFPDIKNLINELREATRSMSIVDKNPLFLPQIEAEPAITPAPASKGILSYMDSIFECDWL